MPVYFHLCVRNRLIFKSSLKIQLDWDKSKFRWHISSSQILVFNIILQENYPRLFGEKADSRSGEEICRLILDYPIVLESKDMLKKKNTKTYHNDGSMSKGHNSQLKEPKLEQYEQEKKNSIGF